MDSEITHSPEVPQQTFEVSFANPHDFSAATRAQQEGSIYRPASINIFSPEVSGPDKLLEQGAQTCMIYFVYDASRGVGRSAHFFSEINTSEMEELKSRAGREPNHTRWWPFRKKSSQLPSDWVDQANLLHYEKYLEFLDTIREMDPKHTEIYIFGGNVFSNDKPDKENALQRRQHTASDFKSLGAHVFDCRSNLDDPQNMWKDDNVLVDLDQKKISVLRM